MLGRLFGIVKNLIVNEETLSTLEVYDEEGGLVNTIHYLENPRSHHYDEDEGLFLLDGTLTEEQITEILTDWDETSQSVNWKQDGF